MDCDAPPVEIWGQRPLPLHVGRLVTLWDFPDSVITGDAVSLELSVTLALGT